MSSSPLLEMLAGAALALVKQQSPIAASVLAALSSTSNADAWKNAGDALLEAAINANHIDDANVCYTEAQKCFARYVYLHRQQAGKKVA
ncbi:hypothetical protein HSX11_13700 [Oxalobacteraceae bacterium]|nr:hypothetical protein [Oxalobacteraceae bacterium]